MDATVNTPVSLGERIGSLDVLRGVAILGILLMNIVTFAMVYSAYTLPTVYDDLDGANWWTWLSLHYIADTKFMSIFSMLFGVGVCIFMERAATRSHAVWKLQVSRMGWLLLIGLVHAYLIWYGDILVAYALCGIVVAYMRNWTPKILFPLGFVTMFVVPIGFMFFIYWTMQYWPEEEILKIKQSANLTSADNQAEIAAYTGNWFGQFSHRLPVAAILQLIIFPCYLFWHIVGLMMVGMAAYKWNILSASKSTRFYVLLVVISAVIGFPLIAIGVWYKQQHGWDPALNNFVDGHWNLVGGVFVAFAWVGIVMLFCKLNWLPCVRKALAAVGRMALTNYIGQSVICSYLFYGHGLVWFGQFERVELLGVVACVWIFQIIFSLIWLRFFRFGPLEWAWRSATYLKLQPLLVSSSS